MGLLQQQQRAVRGGYNFGMLQMPRPLQGTNGFGAQQQQATGLTPSLQPQIFRYAQTQSRELPPYALPQRPPLTPDTLRRHHLSQQQQPKPPHFDLRGRQPGILPQVPEQVGVLLVEVMCEGSEV